MTNSWCSSIESLQASGFTGFRTIGQLRETGLRDVPVEHGVYVILRTCQGEPTFLEKSTGGWFKKKDPSVTPEILKANWVGRTPVIYVGKAGATNGSSNLKKRLKEYLDFGAGKPIGHWGGRLIWHLPESDNLIVAWMPTPDEEPVVVEQRLMNEFFVIHGKRPFANMRN